MFKVGKETKPWCFQASCVCLIARDLFVERILPPPPALWLSSLLMTAVNLRFTYWTRFFMQSLTECTLVISAVHIKALLSELRMYRKLRTDHTFFQCFHLALDVLRCLFAWKKVPLCLLVDMFGSAEWFDYKIKRCVWMSACDYM